jgi:lipopolysaccharide export system protein LptA
MKRSEASRYARWSAITAFVLAGLTGGIYLQRKWVAHVEKRNAPPATPRGVERQISGLTLKKEDGDRTIYVIEASKSTEFQGQEASLLEKVKITIYGKKGDRNDVIHTESCQYEKASGGIQCAGEVLMEMQSAADAQRVRQHPDAIPSVVRVETHAVTFEKATGKAQTSEPVKFSFPNGSGEGLGAIYFSEDGLLQLLHDVHLKLRPPSSSISGKKKTAWTEVTVTGSSLELGKLTHRIVLQGPVLADAGQEKLTAGELTLQLDDAFHAKNLIATPGALGKNPEVLAANPGGTTTLRAEKLTSDLAPEGWVSAIQAEGNVQGSGPAGEVTATRGELKMWPGVNLVKQVTLRGNVLLHSRDLKDNSTRNLHTSALQINYAGSGPGKPNRVQHAETLGRGTLDWTDASSAKSKIEADKLAMDFNGLGIAQQLLATGSVSTERMVPGKPPQTASATNGAVQMGQRGEWSQISLNGNVRLKDGDRTAEAQQALFSKAAQTAVLTGQAVAHDSSSETRAAKITFNQSNGDILAEGDVRSTDLSAKTSAVQLGQAPSNISADHMEGNSKVGRAVYTGHSRLWQGPSVLEADSIELLRDSRVLNAVGHVRGVFPQAQPSQSTSAPQSGQASQPNQGKKGAVAAKKTSNLWHVSAGTLSYMDTENRAHLENNVVVQSADQRMHASALDLFFTHEAGGKIGGGAAQISRAVGVGGVIVEEGDRRGLADQGVYTTADQKFVLSGGNPTLYDSTQGTTTGRELTFYLADDTIIVDSGNGLRTVTRHRVQR